MNSKIGVLLINLGTPDAPTPKAVRIFLKEFLSDNRVIDLPWLIRWILVNFFILPFRPKKSAKNYEVIWQNTGSPLLFHSKQLQKSLQQKLDNNFVVELAMRYGNPDIQTTLDKLIAKQIERLIIIPLFPQYSSAATGSVIEKIMTILKSSKSFPDIYIHSSFYCDNNFIQAYAEVIRSKLSNHHFEKMIFSYHGLPVRQLHNIPEHYNYQKQCFITSELLAKELNLSSQQYLTSFQSRVGRTEWIKPYTDVVLTELAQQGIKHIAIACPSFVTDCLETLEEIGIRAKEQWRKLGGETLALIPCLNSNDKWVEALKEMCVT